MNWQIRITGAGAPTGASEVLDLAALRSLVVLVTGVPLCVLGAVVGHVREPWILGRELFGVAAIEAEAFEMQLREWARRGLLQTVVGLWIHGRRVPTIETECDPSAVYTAVASVNVVDLPHGVGCFLWNDAIREAPGAVLPGLSVPAPRPWRPRPVRGEDPAGDLRLRFARRGPAGFGTPS